MYDKLKDIQISNKHEPRISFALTESYSDNNGVIEIIMKEYDVCLAMVPFTADTVSDLNNMEELVSAVLKQIVEYSTTQ